MINKINRHGESPLKSILRRKIILEIILQYHIKYVNLEKGDLNLKYTFNIEQKRRKNYKFIKENKTLKENDIVSDDQLNSITQGALAYGNFQDAGNQWLGSNFGWIKRRNLKRYFSDSNKIKWLAGLIVYHILSNDNVPNEIDRIATFLNPIITYIYSRFGTHNPKPSRSTIDNFINECKNSPRITRIKTSIEKNQGVNPFAGEIINIENSIKNINAQLSAKGYASIALQLTKDQNGKMTISFPIENLDALIKNTEERGLQQGALYTYGNIGRNAVNNSQQSFRPLSPQDYDYINRRYH